MYNKITEMVKVQLSPTDIQTLNHPYAAEQLPLTFHAVLTQRKGGTSLPFIKGRSKKTSKILCTGTNYNVFTERRLAQASNYAFLCIITVTGCPIPYADQTWLQTCLQTDDILTRHSILKTLLIIFNTSNVHA